MKPFLIITFLFLGCNSSSFEYEYWDMEELNICESKLVSITRIKVLYTSYGYEDEEKNDAFVHTVAINQDTKDTINLLSEYVMRFNTQDVEQVFGFANFDTSLKSKFTKIYRDPRFDDLAKKTSIVLTLGQ